MVLYIQQKISIATSCLLLLLTSCWGQWAGSGHESMELAGSGSGSILIPTEILETIELGSGDAAVSAYAVAAVPTTSSTSSRKPSRFRRPLVVTGAPTSIPSSSSIRNSGLAFTMGPTGSSSTILPAAQPVLIASGSSPVVTARKPPPSVVIINETRSALSQNEPVVFVSEGSNYLPVEHSRNRPRNDERDWKYPLEHWENDYRRRQYNTSRVKHIEAECQEDHMRIRILFNGSFTGLLYSTGYAYDPDCVYINGSGKDFYEFFIELNRCGTLGKSQEDGRKNPSKNLMWNTVTVQYNPLIEEEWDEHFKVTCEYGYDFWKTVSFPFLDVEVATGNPVVFTLTPPECYMEIRHGFGLEGKRVGGPVRVGDELTLIIYMRSKYDGFDLVVNDCVAHNGGSKRIQLIDQYGCPVDDKLFSRFIGSWSEGSLYETQVFAYMKTFRFTGSPALYIECDVRMCHGRCPSQPCHWRNPKVKRSVEGETTPQPVNLSDNLNLYQSLKVLQDGEVEENVTSSRQYAADTNKVCIKTGAFTALFGCASALVAMLTVSLIILCRKTRRLSKESAFSEEILPPRLDNSSFMTHKGRLN